MSSFSDLLGYVETALSGGPSDDQLGTYDDVAAVVARAADWRSGSPRRFLCDVASFVRSGVGQWGNSYAHANGFDKLSLYKSPACGLAVRLHIWWDGSESHVHNHRWDFASHVLSGSVHVTNYEAEPAPRARFRAYEIHDLVGTRKDIRPGAPTRLRAISSAVVARGSGHTLLHHVPHRATTPYDGMTATLVVTGAPQTAVSQSFRLRSQKMSPALPHTLYARGAVAERIDRLVQTLSAPAFE